MRSVFFNFTSLFCLPMSFTYYHSCLLICSFIVLLECYAHCHSVLGLFMNCLVLTQHTYVGATVREAEETCVLDQVSAGFQGRFIISVCMLLFNEKHSHVHVFLFMFVNMLVTCILLELVQLVAQLYLYSISR